MTVNLKMKSPKKDRAESIDQLLHFFMQSQHDAAKRTQWWFKVKIHVSVFASKHLPKPFTQKRFLKVMYERAHCACVWDGEASLINRAH